MDRSFEDTKVNADRGDSAKENNKLDGIKNNVRNVDERQKIIDDFIKQYLPDRGDSKKFTNKPFINDKSRFNTNTIDTKKAHKVVGEESENDVLIIPETGEKVCKTDIKLSYSKPLSDLSKKIESNRPGINDTAYKFRHYFQRDHVGLPNEGRRLNVLNSKVTRNNAYINEKSLKSIAHNENKTTYEVPTERCDLENEMDEQVPIKVTSKFIDQILKQVGVSPRFRDKNAQLHTIGKFNKDKKVVNDSPNNRSTTYGIDSDLNESQTNSPVKVFTKLINGGKLEGLKQRIDPLRDRSVSNGRRLQVTLEEKKKIRARYTLKFKDDEKTVNELSNKTPYNTDKVPKLSDEEQLNQNKSSTESRKSDKSKTERKIKSRKPIIKTIMSKNDSTKVYKAVTFVDQKKVTPLEMNIPEIKRKVSTIMNTAMKSRIKSVVSKASFKEKTRRNDRKRRQRKHTSSPETSVVTGVSPPTEVAKWAPSCINEHTKPYYEAWVNTTLAAIARKGNKDELLLEKERVIQSFQRALERPYSPEIVYENFLDENFTGRIKVRHR